MSSSPPTAAEAVRAAEAAASASDAAPAACEGVLEWPGEWRLHHGGRLDGVRIAWRMVGPAGAPVVAALGGISANRRPVAEDDGWWPAVCGRGLPLDTTRFRVLGLDFLGGSGESTGPVRGGPAFPAISSYDQADVLARVVRELGIGTLHAIAGASYGGS